MSVFSIVVARAGSKGLKNKCLRKIKGRYLFEYSIKYSIELNNKIEEKNFTLVSSDSETIEEYCLTKNIYFIKRKAELASDVTQIEDVIFDAYCRIGKDFEYTSLLYGNIPTRYPEEFLKAYAFLSQNEDYDCVLSMQNVEKYNPSFLFELNKSILPKKNENYRRQDLKQFMVPDGHTVLFRTPYFLKFMETNSKKNIMYEAFGKKIKPMLNNKLIIDIDTQKDLILAEAVLKSRIRIGL